MELKDKLSGMNALGWFTVAFSFLMVGAAGYALGTQAPINKKESATHERFHRDKRLVPEQNQTKQPLQAQPSDIQGRASELPATGPSNPQETPLQPPADDLIYPYDPGYCNPSKPIANRECIY